MPFVEGSRGATGWYWRSSCVGMRVQSWDNRVDTGCSLVAGYDVISGGGVRRPSVTCAIDKRVRGLELIAVAVV